MSGTKEITLSSETIISSDDDSETEVEYGGSSLLELDTPSILSSAEPFGAESKTSTGSTNNSSTAAIKDSNTLQRYSIVDEITPELRNLLQCSSCRSISVPPIYTCEKGHVVCHLCSTKVGTCSKCDSLITSLRNELAEAMVGSFRFKCPFPGCTVKEVIGTEVKHHLETCEFRPILCSIHTEKGQTHPLKCNLLVPFHDYVAHLKEAHKVGGVDSVAAIVNMSTTVKLGQGNWTFPPHYLAAFGKTFLCQIHASFNLFIGWISLCGTDVEAKEFAGSVTIFNPDRKWHQVKWIGQVHPIRSSAQDVYDTGNCLIVLPETFLLLAQVDSEPSSSNSEAPEFDEGFAKKKVKRWTCLFEVHKVKDFSPEGNEEATEEVGSPHNDLDKTPTKVSLESY